MVQKWKMNILYFSKIFYALSDCQTKHVKNVVSSFNQKMVLADTKNVTYHREKLY